MQELPFLRSARRLMLIDICMKFREDSLRGFQVTERTRFVTDRQTDRQTDRRPGKNNMSPNPSGGDIITKGKNCNSNGPKPLISISSIGHILMNMLAKCDEIL